MDRQTVAAIVSLVIVAVVLFLVLVLEVPLAALPAVLTGGSPDVSEADGGFAHVGDGPARFEAAVENLSTCGPTCRNMTATLRHGGQTAAANVSLDMRLTANGSQVWAGTRSIGRLAPGESYRLVQTADVGFDGSQVVLRNDGHVTVWIEVRHADGSETLRKRLEVA